MADTVSMTRHISKFALAALALVIVLLVIVTMPLWSGARAQVVETPAAVPTATVVPQSQAQLTLSYAPLVKQTSPSVVNVFTKKVVRQRRRSIFDEMMGAQRERVQSSLGSGVIVGADGVVVTNNHVIDGADEFRVVLSDRREFPAELVLADRRTDLAVLKIDTGGEALPVLPYADTRDLEVGDLVLAIGNPFGVGQTVTSGIISATSRTDVGISDFAFFIQTDAAINPGNSGGALVGMDGELIGVNTAIFSRSGGSNGIGFAIPAEMVRRVVDAAVNEGQIVRPWLGLKGQAVSFDIAKSQGLDRPVGVMVTDVFDDGPADEAGVRRGDLVKSIDGRDVFDDRGLKFLTATQSPGDIVRLEVLRGGSVQLIDVRLDQPPGATEAELVLLDGQHPFSGAEVAPLSPALVEEMGGDAFGVSSGVLVNKVFRRSYAARTVRPGDIIVSVNGQDIETLDDLNAALEAGDSEWIYVVERNGRQLTGRVRT